MQWLLDHIREGGFMNGTALGEFRWLVGKMCQQTETGDTVRGVCRRQAGRSEGNYGPLVGNVQAYGRTYL